MIPFRNDSSEQVPSFGVMRQTGTVLRDGQLLLTMDKPNTAQQTLLFINGPQPVNAGQYGNCRTLVGDDQASQPIACSGSPTIGTSWGAGTSSWSLLEGRPGFTVLGGGNSNSLAFFRQNHVLEVRGTLDGALYYSGTQTVSVRDMNGSDTGIDITAADFLLTSGQSYASGMVVVLRFIGGRWYVVTPLTAQITFTGTGTIGASGLTFSNPLNIGHDGPWIAVLNDPTKPKDVTYVQGDCEDPIP